MPEQQNIQSPTSAQKPWEDVDDLIFSADIPMPVSDR